MANPIKKCVLHGAVNNETVDLYPRTNLASINDMTAFARTLNGAADAAAARNTLEIATQAALINIIYPVGSVITLTNDTDPNKIYTGTTWQKMDAGRVLVSAGTYTEDGETYTYTLGDKGGEAKHQNTIDEMVAHTHDAVISAVGGHSHGITTGNNTDSPYNLVSTQAKSYNTTRYTNSGGEHSHHISISNAGGNAKHENRQPYQVINRWHRTA